MPHLNVKALRFQSCRHLCQQALTAGSKVPKTADKLQMQPALQQNKAVLSVALQEANSSLNKRKPTAVTAPGQLGRRLHDL